MMLLNTQLSILCLFVFTSAWLTINRFIKWLVSPAQRCFVLVLQPVQAMTAKGKMKLTRKAQCLRRARLMARDRILKVTLERNRGSCKAVVLSSSFIESLLSRRYSAMEVLVTITIDAGVLSALVKMTKRVKSNCMEDSH